ncbi:protein of unknown function [Taphrina deformans PYCC 5710]|uniref:Uncharacterized protein n=1 Tax=Taphrina deformans (strain PYCC 5710 / ATCC 11124 / CBS 356.35 / IMI 108563 / JCM 9778 / NBRC 8474) TaxID=1097556 RepID=R4XDF5_TAPDE|nr:protein of unknown function [Taphrina deformans PYCC 5710]|eukprot:CCG83865.1 protein of unknown function [Taphrina deformans PYCC 5710]
MSTSSSVLYETLDDLPQTSMVPVRATPFAYTPTFAALGDEVPTDAFYDPNVVPRAGSRATHSRNFSRPTNDSSQGRYSRMSTQHPVMSTKLDAQEKPFFSPLLSGGAFPRPEKRQASNSFPEVDANNPNQTYLPRTPPTSDREDRLPSSGFSTPMLAAGVGRMTITSPTIPQTPVSLTDAQRHGPSTTLTYEKDVTPPSTTEAVFPPSSSRSIHSLQSLDSEGSWRNNHRSELDDVVRRSFSRNDNVSRASSNSVIRTPLKRPVSAGSTLRAVISSHDSDTEPSLHQEYALPRRDSETDEHLESPVDRELEDDVDYEQGIWRTGIGKPVQVVTSPLRGSSGPVIIHRSQLGHGDSTSRRGSDEARLSRRASVAGEVDNFYEHGSVAARPSQVMQHGSYMTSMNSFYTANVFSASQSAASSRATLTETNYQ